MKKIIENLIKDELSIYHINIDDFTKNHTHHKEYDGGGHYKAIIVSDDFKNLNLINWINFIFINITIDTIKLAAFIVSSFKNLLKFDT